MKIVGFKSEQESIGFCSIQSEFDNTKLIASIKPYDTNEDIKICLEPLTNRFDEDIRDWKLTYIACRDKHSFEVTELSIFYDYAIMWQDIIMYFINTDIKSCRHMLIHFANLLLKLDHILLSIEYCVLAAAQNCFLTDEIDSCIREIDDAAIYNLKCKIEFIKTVFDNLIKANT